MTDLRVWYDPDHEPATATSAEELRALLDLIQADPEYQDIPTMARISGPDGQRVLQIGLGRSDYSVVLWLDKVSGDALISVGVATALRCATSRSTPRWMPRASSPRQEPSRPRSNGATGRRGPWREVL
jgi:hypothetical protein